VLNHSGEVDAVFAALADPTRRQIVEQLGRGPASVSELAKPLPISLPAVVQHLQVLEASGLVRSEKVGRVRTCRLEVKRLDTVQDWIDARRRTWERRLDRLGDFLAAPATHPDEPTPKGKTP
jgi:DNA-binding transcriptional ArsR family regulator